MAMPDLSNLVRDTIQTDTVTRLLIKARLPFLLQHHPNAWEVATEGLSEPTWLPVLSPRAIMGGSNGMRTPRLNEQASEAYREALDKDARQGLTTIQPDDARARVEGDCASALGDGRYIRTVEVIDPKTKSKGVRHIEAWEVPVATPTGQTQSFKFDRAAHNRWRASLVVRGVIAEPLESVRTSLVRRHKGRVLSAEIDDLPEQVRVRRLKEKADILDGIEAAKIPKAKKPRAVK